MTTEMEELRKHGEKARELRRAIHGTTGEERERRHQEWQEHVKAGKAKFYEKPKTESMPYKHVPKPPTIDRAARLLVDQGFYAAYLLAFNQIVKRRGYDPGSYESIGLEEKKEIANHAFDLAEKTIGTN